MGRILAYFPWGKERFRELGCAGDQLWPAVLIWSTIGFLLGRAPLFGELWPLGLAYAAALPAVSRRGWGIGPPLAVLAGVGSALGVRLALPYLISFILLWTLPGKGEKNRKLWLILLCLLVKTPLHYALQPVKMVFVVGLTECVLASFFFNSFYFVLKRCYEKQLACSELRVLLAVFSLIVSIDWSWGGFSLRLFLISGLIVLAARTDGLRLTCVVGPALGLLVLLLGAPTYLALFIVILGLLTGLFAQYPWGYYLSPVFALLFSFPAPAGLYTLESLVMLFTSVWLARRLPRKHLNHLARIIPGTEAFRQLAKGRDQHLKEVLDNKIDQYLTVFEELEITLFGVKAPLFQQQMRGMSELLQNMKDAFPAQINFTNELQEKLLNQFFALDLDHISVIEGLDGLEVYGALNNFCNLGCSCEKIAESCTEFMSRKYAVVNYGCKDGEVCSFKIAPCPGYSVEIGRAKIAQGEISGDCQVSFEITNSKVAILLSDGMGVGWKAYTESNAAVRLLERMIKAGYDLAASVAVVNRLLLIRNQEEMFVTIDLVVIDLFTGQLEFVKIGSAPSFIKRGREVEIVYNHALPVGVLSQVEVETDRRILKEGEVLVMATDGVLDVQRNIVRKEEWMCWNLRRLKNQGDAATMAAEILQNSLEISPGRIQDDMMVVVARLVPAHREIATYRRTHSGVN